MYRQKTLTERQLQTIVDLVDNTGGVASNTLAAATNVDTLTDSSGGTANTTMTAVGDVTALTGTLTGTANGSLVDVAAAAGACAGAATPSATQVDTAIATAVAPIVTGVNEQLKELQTLTAAIVTDLADAKNNFADLGGQHTKQKALNTVMLNAIASLADKLSDLIEAQRKD